MSYNLSDAARSIAALEQRLRDAEARIAKFRERLEIDHYFSPDDEGRMVRVDVTEDCPVDGITCRDATIEILEDNLTATKARCEELERDARDLRMLLFRQHGSNEHYLYGDDGERTCNTCCVDFKNDTPTVIGEKIHNYNMQKLSAAAIERAALPKLDAGGGEG